jgi:hypothetical protein
VNACGKWIITIYTSSVLPDDESPVAFLAKMPGAQRKTAELAFPDPPPSKLKRASLLACR